MRHPNRFRSDRLTPSFNWALLLSTACLWLAACQGGRVSVGASSPGSGAPDGSSALACVAEHPFVTEFDTLIREQERYTYSSFDGDEPPLPPLLYRDAPSAAGLPAPVGQGQLPCADNSLYTIGVARVDITPPWAGRSRAGYEAPVNVLNGLSQRAYARAFVIGESCSGSRVVLVNADLGFMHRSVRDAVLERMAADPVLQQVDSRGLLISATHTHNVSGGFSNHMMYTGLHLGQKPDVLAAIVDGITTAIAQAWADQQGAQPLPIGLAFNELLHTSANRHPSGYRQNPESERQLYLDVQGEDQLTNRLVTQLNLGRPEQGGKGLINWFSVHPTASLDGTLHGGDSKGYAAYALEKALQSAAKQQNADFVAGFLQSDEGDVVPIRYLDNTLDGQPRLPPLVTEVLGEDVNAQLANVAISGTRQMANALQLWTQAEQHAVHGSVDYRLRYVDFSDQEVTDPVVLAALPHPDALDTPIKRTCDPMYGISSVGKEVFGKYQSCEDAVNVPIEEFLQDLQAGNVQRSFGDAAKIALCVIGDLDLSPAGGADYSCQAEKAYLFGQGDKGPVTTPVLLPIQLLRIGNLVVISLPWEITTMTGRRIRETVLKELRSIGVDYAVIAGLSNEYAGYLTTRSEYARQGYEASSNQFGPWTLAVVQQELRALALSMVQGTVPDPVPPIEPGSPDIPNLVLTDPLLVDLPLRGAYTAPLSTLGAEYEAGESLHFRYQAAHPNNDVYRQGHYFSIERQQADGEWVSWSSDADPETVLHWESSAQDQYLPAVDSVMDIQWYISRDTPPGRYRIRYRTTAREAPLLLTEYSATSAEFVVNNPQPACSWGGRSD